MMTRSSGTVIYVGEKPEAAAPAAGLNVAAVNGILTADVSESAA